MANKEHFHLIGICGVAMGTLACMLREKGHIVSGSDSKAYPPMSTVLKTKDILIYEGYRSENIIGSPIVIIGNALSRGNPEVEYVLDENIHYMSMTDCLFSYFLKNKTVIAVTGTHGKTTTTALLAHIFEIAGLEPSFFIGGVMTNYGKNFKLNKGKYFIIEGDEYDSAFFEKFPKFIMYRPHHLIITSLEFDHADIYNNVSEIEHWFKGLINCIPRSGTIIYSDLYDNIINLAANAYGKIRSFGGERSDYAITNLFLENNISTFDIENKHNENNSFKIKTSLIGNFNRQNIIAAAAMALELGIEKTSIAKAIETFHGVKRRQELIYSNNNIKIYEDFAHHPTSIKYILSAMREQYPQACLWAIYEPRSATSRRNIHQKELINSFKESDWTLIKNPYNLESIPQKDQINIHEVIEKINAYKENSCSLFNSSNEIIEFILKNMNSEEDNIILLMSNGGFDNIYKKITTAFSNKN